MGTSIMGSDKIVKATQWQTQYKKFNDKEAEWTILNVFALSMWVCVSVSVRVCVSALLIDGK